MNTIKQLADELGVSKQAIRKQIAKLPPTMISTSNNRTILINDEDSAIIRAKVATSNNRVGTNLPPTLAPEVGTIISMLQKELDSKNATIESQSHQLEQAHKSIRDLTAALASAQLSAQQAQALHAGTMHKQLEAGAGELRQKDTADQTYQKPEKRPSLFTRIFGNR